jgi:hypothetical protein
VEARENPHANRLLLQENSINMTVETMLVILLSHSDADEESD